MVIKFYASIFISLRVGVSSFCENGYEHLGSVRGGEFLEQFNCQQLFNLDHVRGV